ncbi:ectoine/hydroxyectoine ABC transporter substrate-binding protein EhuB [Bradyrhizobium sp. 18]|uniref:ectoine/hydroxyectoine ABC transporter substrate-binding protein EhuB n=1 Tax=Bradyrhizobium sp. 18 TaxID=2782657 RepID=UPI001FF7BB55|nr:ectoine/hydroxyectoine ABC transporter substrate-binding protein EhuB [Bradyrhizobium sp. 18]MCK1505425.1 ectoine/hydroxyectoine ABC transporter substrate-binding protein EhuB [Bradyrhizobium sp. 18]
MTIRKAVAAVVGMALALEGASTARAQDALARARQAGKVTVGIFNQSPWGFVDANGEAKGQAVDVLKAAFAPLGITKIDVVVTEFGALLPGLQAHRFDVVAAGLYIKPERCKLVAFGNPDIKMGDAFLVPRGNPKSLHSYADIAQKSDVVLGVGKGSVEVQYALDAGIPKKRLLQFPDADSSLSALLAGRIDALAATTATITAGAAVSDKLERALPFTQPVGADGKVIYGFPALAFRQADSDFRDAYNVELNKLRESGELLKILAAYGFTDSELPPADLTAADLCR